MMFWFLFLSGFKICKVFFFRCACCDPTFSIVNLSTVSMCFFVFLLCLMCFNGKLLFLFVTPCKCFVSVLFFWLVSESKRFLRHNEESIRVIRVSCSYHIIPLFSLLHNRTLFGVVLFMFLLRLYLQINVARICPNDVHDVFKYLRRIIRLQLYNCC
uniref:Secreted protein n=1 Tax=Anopheles darlingi TaxID=43151 RepID=A0A2M4CWB5_ANODA